MSRSLVPRLIRCIGDSFCSNTETNRAMHAIGGRRVIRQHLWHVMSNGFLPQMARASLHKNVINTGADRALLPPGIPFSSLPWFPTPKVTQRYAQSAGGRTVRMSMPYDRQQPSEVCISANKSRNQSSTETRAQILVGCH